MKGEYSLRNVVKLDGSRKVREGAQNLIYALRPLREITLQSLRGNRLKLNLITHHRQHRQLLGFFHFACVIIEIDKSRGLIIRHILDVNFEFMCGFLSVLSEGHRKVRLENIIALDGERLVFLKYGSIFCNGSL